MNLKDWISSRHGAQAELARATGIHAPSISQWASGLRQVPIPRCKQIEDATGGAVTRRDLRPDDWHRIWPELIGTTPAPEQAQAGEGGHA
jgi:DNA-binding transcriptional regulator YdaS (Cro superfamily)